MKLEQNRAHEIALDFSAVRMFLIKNISTHINPFISGKMDELKMFVFFNQDGQYQPRNSLQLMNLWNSVLFQILFIWFILSIAMLTILQKKIRTENNDFSTNHLDMVIVFIGGGNLRFNLIQENWKKIFFASNLIGMLFLQSLGMFGVLYQSFVVSDNRIDTFEKLAKSNLPIYLFRSVDGNENSFRQIIE